MGGYIGPKSDYTTRGMVDDALEPIEADLKRVPGSADPPMPMVLAVRAICVLARAVADVADAIANQER